MKKSAKKRPYEAKKLKKKIGHLWKTLEKAAIGKETISSQRVEELFKLAEEYGHMADSAWKEDWNRCHERIKECGHLILQGEGNAATDVIEEVKGMIKQCHKIYK